MTNPAQPARILLGNGHIAHAPRPDTGRTLCGRWFDAELRQPEAPPDAQRCRHCFR